MTALKCIRVLQVTDSLCAAGLERVAVNLANLLPRPMYQNYLCTTRANGPLERELKNDVHLLALNRTKRFDVCAFHRLIRFNKKHHIDIIHAHGTSLFIAGLVSIFPPYPAVIWHDHWGQFGLKERPIWLYRLATSRANGVIAVSRPLADWSHIKLHVPSKRVWYLPNFVLPSIKQTAPQALPGTKTQRIACVARLQPQKDHLTLVRAMGIVATQFPTAHLLLVGSDSNTEYSQRIRNEIHRMHLTKNISLLGERHDVNALLQSCAIGVLSSASEGFPLALLEYGMAGLSVVTTNVGQCTEVIDHMQTGLVVSPGQPAALASALTTLLKDQAMASKFGEQLKERVLKTFSPDNIVKRICHIYGEVLASKRNW